VSDFQTRLKLQPNNLGPHRTARMLPLRLPAAVISVLAKGSLSEFFRCGKHADPDIRILKQAKAEHAKLQ
jgi:hypothetical protein